MQTTYFFDIILSPAFMVIVPIIFIAAIIALIVLSKRGKLTGTHKGILITVILLCALYIAFVAVLSYLWGRTAARARLHADGIMLFFTLSI